jgi:hypothetical protein
MSCVPPEDAEQERAAAGGVPGEEVVRSEIRDGDTVIAQWNEHDGRPGLTVAPLLWPLVMIGSMPYEVKAGELVYYEDGEAVFDFGPETTVTLGACRKAAQRAKS